MRWTLPRGTQKQVLRTPPITWGHLRQTILEEAGARLGQRQQWGRELHSDAPSLARPFLRGLMGSQAGCHLW